MRRVAPVLILMALSAALAGCGGSSGDGADAASAPAATSAPATTSAPVAFEGGTVSPVRAAPPLRLADSDGRTVDITDYRGRPVLVTFVYATCPDVCPLIMQNLRRVRRDAGPLGRRMRVIAVSVDPKGDTPAVVRRFLRVQHLQGFVRYLVGTRAQLEPVWDAWQIARDVPRDQPELVEHSALIYGVTASGNLATAYPVNFASDAVARDLAKLEAQ